MASLTSHLWRNAVRCGTDTNGGRARASDPCTRRVINGGYEALWAIDLITGPFVTTASPCSVSEKVVKERKPIGGKGRPRPPRAGKIP